MILIISTCQEPLHELEFVNPIVNIVKQHDKFKVIHYSKLKDSDTNSASKIIITGTSLQDNEFIKHLNKFNWIKTYKKPLLGICAGSHIIGLLLGYKLKKSKHPEIGLKELNLKKSFLGSIGKLQVYHLHQFFVLPEVFHKDNIYGFLFHPEVRNAEMVERFVEL